MKAFFTIILFTSIASSGHSQSGADCLPVETLKSLYASDKTFRSTIDEMFLHVQDLPGNAVNPWKNKNINDLYHFLNDWFYTLPTSSDALDKILEFSYLYYRNPYGLRFVQQEPGLSWTNLFVKEEGKYMDSPASAKRINEWLADKSLGNEDYEIPATGFTSFNNFFTRNLKPGARTIDSYDDTSVVVSPVDGILNWIENDLGSDSTIPVKGRMALNLQQIFGNSAYAGKFEKGTALSFVLLPENYHHYHAPVSGIIVESRENVGQALFGTQVADIVEKGNPGHQLDFSVFENYQHGYFIMKTNAFGYVGVVPVGLETIGSVVFEQPLKNIRAGQREIAIHKGDRLGHFAYGGSLVMVFFEKNRFRRLSVRQGQRVGQLAR